MLSDSDKNTSEVTSSSRELDYPFNKQPI